MNYNFVNVFRSARKRKEKMDHDSEDDDLQSSGGFSSSSEEEEEKSPLHGSTTTPSSAYRLTFGASGLRKRKDRLASLYHFPGTRPRCPLACLPPPQADYEPTPFGS
jgi:hypothetical protein